MACLLNHSAQIMRPRSSVTASPRVSVRQAPAVRNVAVRIFKWGKNGLGAQDAGIVGAQMREDWSRSDVEVSQYIPWPAISHSHSCPSPCHAGC